MYELGYAHAMSKGVIMIYEENKDVDKEVKFPYDIRYIEIKIYKKKYYKNRKLHRILKKLLTILCQI